MPDLHTAKLIHTAAGFSLSLDGQELKGVRGYDVGMQMGNVLTLSLEILIAQESTIICEPLGRGTLMKKESLSDA